MDGYLATIAACLVAFAVCTALVQVYSEMAARVWSNLMRVTAQGVADTDRVTVLTPMVPVTSILVYRNSKQ